MILSLVFVGLLASAAVADRDLNRPYRFAPGKSYLYDYSARLETGIPKISDQFSAYQIRADIEIQSRSAGSNEVKLRLGNIRTSQTDGGSEEAAVPHEWNREYEKELSKPVVFTHQNGRVINFRAERSEPEWSLNIKKSILSLFTLDLEPKSILRLPEGNNVPQPVSHDQLTFYGVLEQGMGGECETTYELNQIPSEESDGQDAVLNVTKTRNYGKCKTRQVLTKENFSLQHQEQHGDQSWSAVKGYYPVPSGAQPQQEQQDWEQERIVKQYNCVKYNISMTSQVAIIESILSQGRVVYNTYGDKIMAMTEQNVTLKNQPEEEEAMAPIDTISAIASQKHEDLSFRLPQVSLPGQSVQGQKQRMDIPHMALYGQQKTSELVKKMPKYFQTLAKAVLDSDADSKDAMQLVIEIVNTFQSLPRPALDQLFKQIAEPGRERKDATQEQQVMRKILLDSLALCGTNDAAMLIKQKIVSHQVSSNEARELLEALPHNMYLPDVKTIDAFQQLCQHPRVLNRPIVHTACSVCFAKLVQNGSKKSASAHSSFQRQNWWTQGSQQEIQDDEDDNNNNNSEQANEWDNMFVQKTISQSDVERYVQVASRQLDQADTFQKKVAAIETLAHMAVPQALNSLKPYVTGDAPESVVPGYQIEEGQSIEKEANFVRTIAIYSMAHIAKRYPEQVKPLVLPVFRNQEEPHQLRLAAFTILMLCQPEEHILQSIAADLKHESDKHIVQFVATALKSAGKLDTPCMQDLADAAREASDSGPKVRKTNKYSQFVARDYFSAKKDFGLLAIGEVIQSQRSPIPKAAYASLTETTSEFHEQFLEIGFNAKGLEKLVHRIAGRNGLISSILQNKQTPKAPKTNMVPIEEAARIVRNRISSSLNYKKAGKDSARLDVFFKLFERTSVYALDEAALFDLIEDAESAVNSWANDYANGYTGTYAKVFMPASLTQVIPSELGLPIVVSHKNPIILSLQIKNAKLNRSNGQFQVSAEIEPKCMHSSYTFVFGAVPALKSAVGTHVEKTTHASLPLRLRVAYKHNQNKWSVNIQPKSDEVFYHKTDAKTFVSKIHLATTPSREWLEAAQSIRSPDSSSSKMEKRFTYKNLPVSAQVSLETEEKLQDPKYLQKKVQKNGLIPTIVDVFQNSGLNAREVHVSLRSEDRDSAFDYEWDVSQQQQEQEQDENEESRRQEQQGEENEYEEFYDSSEEQHEEEERDNLMAEIVDRVNGAISGKGDENGNSQWLRKSASQWMEKTKQGMKWIEDFKDYEQEERQTERKSSQKQQQQECQTMKTHFIQENGRICFTTRPVPACQPGCQQQASKQVTRNFHCLPMASPFTAQLMAQAETKVLDRLTNKRVDFSRKLSTPASCSA